MRKTELKELKYQALQFRFIRSTVHTGTVDLNQGRLLHPVLHPYLHPGLFCILFCMTDRIFFKIEFV